MTGSATIYLRQSQDKEGARTAVSRQLDECRQLCDARGWKVREVFTDNDISATSGKRRPAFEALLSSRPERIVVWHIDRLVRLSRELERVLDLGVNVYAVRSGELDLSNAAGRAVAKTVTAWAQYEGEHKAERQVAANRQRAGAGSVLWTRRPFGFDRDGRVVRLVEAEAAEVRKAAGAVLAGATLASVVADFNARGVTTTLGEQWTVTTLRRVLLNPRTSGRTVSNGVDYGHQGNPAILDQQTADRLTAILTDPRRRTQPSTRVKYLLSGLAVCGRCGDEGPAPVMFATSNAGGAMVYRCRACYSTRRMADVDDLVLGVLIERLSRSDAVTLFRADEALGELREQVVELRDRRDGLAALLADGLQSVEAVRTHAARLTERIAELERRIDAASASSPLADVIGTVDVGTALRGLPLPKVRQVISTLLTVRIMPAGKGVRFNPEQVEMVWKEGTGDDT